MLKLNQQVDLRHLFLSIVVLWTNGLNRQKQAYIETDGRGLHPGVDGGKLRRKKMKILVFTKINTTKVVFVNSCLSTCITITVDFSAR